MHKVLASHPMVKASAPLPMTKVLPPRQRDVPPEVPPPEAPSPDSDVTPVVSPGVPGDVPPEVSPVFRHAINDLD